MFLIIVRDWDTNEMREHSICDLLRTAKAVMKTSLLCDWELVRPQHALYICGLSQIS